MNPKKTHFTGLFRESCGKHYHGGFDVSPFYIRREVRELPDLINLLNQVLEWDGRGWGCLMSPTLLAFHRKWAAFVPRRLHGGIDTNDPSALVTGDLPRHRLVPIMKEVKRPSEDASLNLWLLTMNQINPRDPLVSVDDWWREYLPTEPRMGEIGFALTLDPRRVTGFRTKPIKHRGARTTWVPYLLEETTKCA
jgi:hypothetical protein